MDATTDLSDNVFEDFDAWMATSWVIDDYTRKLGDER